jgi:hypothetical protein
MMRSGSTAKSMPAASGFSGLASMATYARPEGSTTISAGRKFSGVSMGKGATLQATAGARGPFRDAWLACVGQ